jgi:hypothetical protein
MSPEKGLLVIASRAAAILAWSLAGNLASCFCAASATTTVQFMEQFRQSYEPTPRDLSFAFANGRQLCFCGLITWFLKRCNRNRTPRSLKLQAITALDTRSALYANRHHQLIPLLADGSHVCLYSTPTPHPAPPASNTAPARSSPGIGPDPRSLLHVTSPSAHSPSRGSPRTSSSRPACDASWH